MKNLVRVLSAAVVALAVSVSAQAQSKNAPGTKVAKPSSYQDSTPYRGVAQYGGGGSFTHEIQTYSTRGGFVAGKACKDCETGTTIDIGASYLHYWQNNVQFGADVRLQSLSQEVAVGGSSATLIDIIGLAVYNFDPNLSNSFYAKGGIGLYSVVQDDLSGYENKFGLQVGGGKRFPIFGNITYSPELNLVKRGDIDFAIELKLINLGISWN
ncbi:hypothetical protein D3C87_176660 [compost metagenome]